MIQRSKHGTRGSDYPDRSTRDDRIAAVRGKHLVRARRRGVFEKLCPSGANLVGAPGNPGLLR